MKKINIVEIAKISGVTPSTVSRALNNRSDISKETREKILSCCRKHGFSRNMTARSLRMRSSDTVIFIMPDYTYELYIEKLNALKNEVKKAGFKWHLHSYDYFKPEETLDLFHDAAGSRPAGIISAYPPDNDNVNVLKTNRIPTVLYDCNASGFDSVMLDLKKGYFDAVSLMLEKGRRKIILFGDQLESPRGEAYAYALKSKGLEIDQHMFFPLRFGPDLFTEGYNGARKIIGKQKFDGLMCVNDASAIGAMKALNESGIRVPEDVSVCGLDDMKVSKYTIPPLSTVSQPVGEMAGNAIALLLRRIKDFNSSCKTITLHTSLILRESI
ncbi:MAG TPA: hypothetical protein DCZ94_00040 [Lentisphaeria bacterium]|nr:MAG: hypothetical protein A2X48_00620 [Lentisphaerae bacterium GWF2_49_21]HBC85322.1 hypothetical protein [Lentisphaeria bacterium]